jgi:hypothetical protein
MKLRIKGAALPMLGLAVAMLSLVPAALAHGGDENMGMEMSQNHGHGEPAPRPSEDSYPETYFSHPELQGILYAHVAAMVVGWVVVLPVGKLAIAILVIAEVLGAGRRALLLTRTRSQPSCSRSRGRDTLSQHSSCLASSTAWA